MSKQLLRLENTPPRTSVPKTLHLGTNEADGNFTLTIWGGWSEYKPEDVEKIRTACDEYLNSLIPWACPNCNNENQAVPKNNPSLGYTWVRCRHCHKKFERDRVLDSGAQHI
jgi:hypothetical protein